MEVLKVAYHGPPELLPTALDLLHAFKGQRIKAVGELLPEAFLPMFGDPEDDFSPPLPPVATVYQLEAEPEDGPHSYIALVELKHPELDFTLWRAIMVEPSDNGYDLHICELAMAYSSFAAPSEAELMNGLGLSKASIEA